jgi:hypothetical protein
MKQIKVTTEYVVQRSYLETSPFNTTSDEIEDDYFESNENILNIETSV